MPRVRSFHLHNMRYLAIIFVFGLFTISHCTVRAQAPVTAGGAVLLSCQPPVSSPDPVAGYLFLRSPSGTYTFAQLNAAAVASCLFTDSTAVSGQSYDYIAEAVDASGVTSAPTNIATATGPPASISIPVPAKPTVTVNP